MFWGPYANGIYGIMDDTALSWTDEEEKHSIRYYCLNIANFVVKPVHVDRVWVISEW